MRSCLMLVFALVIDAGVGVGVVCAFVFPIFDLTQHPTRTLQPATPKFCSQNSPSKRSAQTAILFGHLLPATETPCDAAGRAAGFFHPE